MGAHGVVYGQKKRGGIGSKLRDGAIWVVTPLTMLCGYILAQQFLSPRLLGIPLCKLLRRKEFNDLLTQ